MLAAMSPSTLSCCVPLLLALVSAPGPRSQAAEDEAQSLPVALELDQERVRVRVDGQVFTDFVWSDTRRPYLYPLLGPGEVPMTRAWPQEEREGEARDHPHHTSFWFAHGNVNGIDFWHPQSDHGGVVEFTGRLKELLKRGKRMRLRHEYKWKDKQGNELLHERRTTLLGAEDDLRWVDMKFELTALQDEVRFGDTKEGTFALRMHPNLRLRGDVANGKAVNEGGVTGKAVWGKRAAWVHYQGEVDGAPVGVAIFEHDGNFRHPTWWHARDYGLVAANPFGVHDFERKPAGTGDHVLERGQTLVLQYRVWIHSGHKTPEEVAAAYEAYKIQAEDV